LARLLVVHGTSYVKKFAERTGGFVVLRHRLRRWWHVPAVWSLCFAILFGHDIVKIDFDRTFDLFSLLDIFLVEARAKVVYPDILPAITGMLQNGLKAVVTDHRGPQPTQRKHNNDDTSLNKLSARPPHHRPRSVSMNMESIPNSRSRGY
jgi:hypothetical protein